MKSLLTIIFFTLIFFSPTKAYAQPAPEKWSGACVYEVDGQEIPTIQGLQCMIANVFSIFLSFTGMAGFLMMIYGSVKWMISGNDSGGVETAQKTLTFAVAGIVVAVSSFVVLGLIGEFTGVNIITKFIIPHWTRIWP